jgi:hypothetical protein
MKNTSPSAIKIESRNSMVDRHELSGPPKRSESATRTAASPPKTASIFQVSSKNGTAPAT